MKNNKIIGHFNLNSVTWLIEEDKDIFELESSFGKCHSKERVIRITNNIKPDLRDLVLWHEITHSILDDMGRNDLYENEEFVYAMANSISQVLKSLELDREGY